MTRDTDPKLARIERHYRRVYQHLAAHDLTQPDEWPSHTEGLETSGDESDCRFLDFYSVDGLRTALEHYGFLDQIRIRGLGEPMLSLHRHHMGYDILRLRSPRVSQPVVELVTQIGSLPPECRKVCGTDPDDRKFLHVRWLKMQNPTLPVSAEKPLLPGQEFPGLGLGREMMVLLQLICGRLGLDGVLELPERLHNAILYFRRFRFLDPRMQGIVTAILRDTQDRVLTELAWGVELGGLIDTATGKPFRWLPQEQILARTGPVLEHLNSREYQARARTEMDRHHFLLSSGDLASDLALRPPGGDDPIPSRIK